MREFEMRALILVAAAAVTLSACGEKKSEEANVIDANAIIVDNSADTSMDMNAMTDANGMMMNDAQAMDMNTNEPDTNTANGM